jgi:hypothetical protein
LYDRESTSAGSSHLVVVVVVVVVIVVVVVVVVAYDVVLLLIRSHCGGSKVSLNDRGNVWGRGHVSFASSGPPSVFIHHGGLLTEQSPSSSLDPLPQLRIQPLSPPL